MLNDQAAQGGHPHLARATPDVDHQRPRRLTHGQPGSDRRGKRLLDQNRLRRSRIERRLLNRVPLDRSDPAGHTDDHMRTRTRTGRPGDEMPQHLLGHLEVRDHSVPKRTRRADMRRCPPDHPPRLLSHRLYLAGALIKRDHRGLEQHHPLATTEHNRIRGPQIDRELTPNPGTKPHATTPRACDPTPRP